MKAIRATFNQEKALVGAFSHRFIVYSTSYHDVMLGQVTHWSAWIRRWRGQLIFALHL